MVKGGRTTNSESRVRATLCSSAWLLFACAIHQGLRHISNAGTCNIAMSQYHDASDHEGEGDDGVEVGSTCRRPHICNQRDQHLRTQTDMSCMTYA